MKVKVPFDLRHDSRTSYTIACAGGLLLAFEDSGRRARVGALGFEAFRWRDVLRWGAPFALSPQGHVALHGSAVRRDGGPLVAFLGVGGAGKSTLGSGLRRRGWQQVADDVIFCAGGRLVRLDGEDVLRAWVAGHDGRIDPTTPVDYAGLSRRLAAPSPAGTAPLAAVAFLDEVRAAGAEFVARPLSGAEAFCGLVKYGFGGLPCPAAWRRQFEVYGALAARTTAVRLAAPEGLAPAEAALGQLEGLIDRWLAVAAGGAGPGAR
ncbi:MAG TPA: hypothetical protein VFW33_01405 [Gemmataceae bacterium]|nr:hypothetical protein [Gemmataceae bacterium]